jgi:hypothetical protein
MGTDCAVNPLPGQCLLLASFQHAPGNLFLVPSDSVIRGTGRWDSEMSSSEPFAKRKRQE